MCVFGKLWRRHGDEEEGGKRGRNDSFFIQQVLCFSRISEHKFSAADLWPLFLQWPSNRHWLFPLEQRHTLVYLVNYHIIYIYLIQCFSVFRFLFNIYLIKCLYCHFFKETHTPGVGLLPLAQPGGRCGIDQNRISHNYKTTCCVWSSLLFSVSHTNTHTHFD